MEGSSVERSKGELVRRAIVALSDETRYRIAKSLIEEGSATAGELAERVSKARSTVDEHLEELLETGLLSRRKVNRKYVYEATELAKACIDLMEGRGSKDELYRSLPDKVQLKVKVKEASSLEMVIKTMIKAPAFIGVTLGILFILVRPYAPWLDVRILVLISGLLFGVISSEKFMKVERRDVVAFCLTLTLVMALMAPFQVEGHSFFIVFIVGFLYYLAWFLLAAFIPFEVARFLLREHM